MSEPFLGMIAIFGFDFAPPGYAQCDGQILPINQNQSLYSLLGTTYGGDGRTSFALPDLRGRVPIHTGNSNTAGSSSHALGQKSGQETVPLTANQIPNHTHTTDAREGSTDAATSGDPTGNLPAPVSNGANVYGEATNLTDGGVVQVSSVGANQAHTNMQPYQTINFCIALQGLFPSRN